MLDIAATLKDVIALGRGDPDLDTPPHIVEAGRGPSPTGATHYTHPHGLPAIARGDRSLDRGRPAVPPTPTDEIVVTAGAQESIFVAMLALVNPATRSSSLRPATTPIIRPWNSPRQDGHRADLSSSDGLRADCRGGREGVDAARARILCLINPSNPTGMVIPPSEIEQLAAARHGARPHRRIRRDLRQAGLRQCPRPAASPRCRACASARSPSTASRRPIR